MARAAGADRARAARTRRRSRERLRDVDARGDHVARRARRAAGAAQARAARAPAAPRRGATPFGGFAAIGWGARAPARRALRVFASPGPIHEPEAARRRLLAHGAGAVRRRLSRRRPGPQQLQLPLHAGRRDDGKRRARARLHRLSRRHRPDRAAGAGDGRRCAPDGLRRHAELPAPAAREGRRDRRRRCRR